MLLQYFSDDFQNIHFQMEIIDLQVDISLKIYKTVSTEALRVKRVLDSHKIS